MDRADRRGERRLVVRMLLLSLRLLPVGLPSLVSLRPRLSIRGRLSLPAGTGSGAAGAAAAAKRARSTHPVAAYAAIMQEASWDGRFRLTPSARASRGG